MQWVVISCLISCLIALSMGFVVRDDKLTQEDTENVELLLECCWTHILLPVSFITSTDSCGIDNGVKDSETYCSTECTLGRAGVLLENRNINERKARELCMAGVTIPDERALISKALDKCFDDHKVEILEMSQCEATAMWLGCMYGEITVNCPARLRKTEDPKCVGVENIKIPF